MPEVTADLRTQADLEAWVVHTRLVQGLPARVEDPTVLARIADLPCTDQLANRKGEEPNDV